MHLTCLTVLSHQPRAPGPQKPQSNIADDIVRSNHYDPDEDEDYYRKQLSYFDKLQAGPNKPQPQAQATHNYPRWCSFPCTIIDLDLDLCLFQLSLKLSVTFFMVFNFCLVHIYCECWIDGFGLSIQDRVCGETNSSGEKIWTSSPGDAFSATSHTAQTSTWR